MNTKAIQNLDWQGDLPIPLSRFQAAMGRSSSTIYRWRKLGILETVNIRGKLFVSKEALQKFLGRAGAGEFAAASPFHNHNSEN